MKETKQTQKVVVVIPRKDSPALKHSEIGAASDSSGECLILILDCIIALCHCNREKQEVNRICLLRRVAGRNRT
jgi:hypothetical protein